MKHKFKALEYLSWPFRVIYKIYFLFIFSFTLLAIFPALYYLLATPGRFPKAFVLMRYFAFGLFFMTGIRVKVKGIENIPQSGAYIICANHTSFLDAFCIYAIFRQYFVFIGKKEIEKWPLFHIAYTSGMNILVDRHSASGSVKALKRMMEEIGKGHPLAMFPEGTISKHPPATGPFKPGAFSLAIQKQVPVLPITFVTNWKRLQRGSIWKGKASPGIAEIVIHPPVPTSGMQKEAIDGLQNQVRNMIMGAL